MAEEGAGDQWGSQLEEHLSSACYGGAIAYKACGSMFAASPVANEAGWAICYADAADRDVLKEDGETTEQIRIEENQHLAMLVKNVEEGKSPPTPRGGLWLGGIKYIVTKSEEAEVEGQGDDGKSQKFYVIMARGAGDEKLKKKGVILQTSKEYITLGFYDEEENQTAGSARNAVQLFANWCIESGL